MTNSQKFELLIQFRENNTEYFSKIIPPLIDVHSYEVSESFFSSKKSYILRSSQKNEGTQVSLLSGKSISIKGVVTHDDFLKALEKIISQENLDKVYLQEEFDFVEHLTIYVEGEFFYIESKKENEIKTLVRTKYFSSGKHDNEKILKKFIEKWSELELEGGHILEVGVREEEIKLFQAVSVSKNLISNIFSNDLLIKLIKNEARSSKKMNFTDLIKNEISSHRFRKTSLRKETFSIEDAFNNWSYIFHYFFLYCKIESRPGVDQDFIDFLNSCQKNANLISKIAFKHIQLAQKIRTHENKKSEISLESSFRLVSEEAYFLGSGIVQGRVEDIALLFETLIPEVIYNLKSNKIIITSDYHILSHGFLAAIEKGIPVLANLSQQKYLKIEGQDFLTVDFTKKYFELK